MDDAQRAEKRRLGGKSSKSDGLKLRRNKNRCWFPDLGFQRVVFRAWFPEKHWGTKAEAFVRQ